MGLLSIWQYLGLYASREMSKWLAFMDLLYSILMYAAGGENTTTVQLGMVFICVLITIFIVHVLKIWVVSEPILRLFYSHL